MWERWQTRSDKDPVKPHLAARMAFLLSEDAGMLKRSALFCSLWFTKRQKWTWRQICFCCVMYILCFRLHNVTKIFFFFCTDAIRTSVAVAGGVIFTTFFSACLKENRTRMNKDWKCVFSSAAFKSLPLCHDLTGNSQKRDICWYYNWHREDKRKSLMTWRKIRGCTTNGF